VQKKNIFIASQDITQINRMLPHVRDNLSL
jgi:hypothetical protein